MTSTSTVNLEPQAARVTAADYNGSTWDGVPFRPFPRWLLEAIKGHRVRPVTPNNTDYAEWEVGGFLASPDDWIVNVDGDLRVVKSAIAKRILHAASRR